MKHILAVYKRFLYKALGSSDYSLIYKLVDLIQPKVIHTGLERHD